MERLLTALAVFVLSGVFNYSHAQPRLTMASVVAQNPTSFNVNVRLEGDVRNVSGLQFEIRLSAFLFSAGPLVFNSGRPGDAITGQKVEFAQTYPGALRVTVWPDAAGTSLRSGTLAVLNFALTQQSSPIISPRLVWAQGAVDAATAMDGRAILVHPSLAQVDTDGDGVGDGAEVSQGTHPLVKDTAPTFVAAPRMSPAGGTFDDSVLVTMTTETNLAKIWYARGGVDPVPGTNYSVLYTGPIRLVKSETVKAIAVFTSHTGDVVTSTVTPAVDFQVNALPTVAPPRIFPDSASVPVGNVTMATTTPDATIYYTTNGSTPSAANGIRYSAPLSFASPIVVKATATKRGYRDSGVVTAVFNAAPQGGPNVTTAPIASPSVLTVAVNDVGAGQLTASDADGSSLTYSIINTPAHGLVDLNSSTGQFHYTPDTDFSGTDGFSFRVSDGALDSNIATVEITVTDSTVPTLPRLRVSSDGRYLETENGKPFFWLADTAWRMFKLTREEIGAYFRDRAARGFNVVLGPNILPLEAIEKADGIVCSRYPCLIPNAEGNEPLTGYDFSTEHPKPGEWNQSYLEYLDYIVDTAASNGIYIALSLVWGPALDEIFDKGDPNLGNSVSLSPAYRISKTLAQRYADRTNVMWIVAGEFHKVSRPAVKYLPREYSEEIENAYAAELNLIRELARGLEDGHGGNSLMTSHPRGGTSTSLYFHNESWLDFNMVQMYSLGREGDRLLIPSDWDRVPAKPTVVGEPGYEHRQRQTSDSSPQTGEPIDDWKTRYQAYVFTLQGGFGFSYGNSLVWQFATGWNGEPVITPPADYLSPAPLPHGLAATGGDAMRHLRALIESRPMTIRSPDIELVSGDRGTLSNMTRLEAARASDGSYAFVYFPQATMARNIDLSRLSGTTINAWWFNPRDGQVYSADGTTITGRPFASYTAGQAITFDPPGDLATNDWVLVLDDAGKNFCVPGAAVDSANAAAVPDESAAIESL